ncbi:MAG: 4Fe-4S binding protein [Desulfurococcaceae archaeon]
MRVAFVSLTGCEGCLYNVVDSQLLFLLEKYSAEITYWRLIGARKNDKYDIAVIEGSVTSKEDIKRIQDLRERSRILVALGSCAIYGGVHSRSTDEVGYKTPTSLFSHVRVDYYIRGCPANTSELLEFLERVFKGERPSRYERRFNLTELPVVNVSDSDSFISLDSSKCIVCGRCIEICKSVQANVLNYVNRGITTTVSTPYNEYFDKAGCHYCGLCIAYCPVGAIKFRLHPEILARSNGLDIYIEPEALAALAESERANPQRILRAIRELGFNRIIVYSSIVDAQPGLIYAKSPAEYYLLRRKIPSVEVKLLSPRIPSNAIYVTQCIAWRRSMKNAITTRELQIALRSALMNTGIKDVEEPLAIDIDPGIRFTSSINELVELWKIDSNQALVYTLCPGGCLMGGGQPLSPSSSWSEIYHERARILAMYLKNR